VASYFFTIERRRWTLSTDWTASTAWQISAQAQSGQKHCQFDRPSRLAGLECRVGPEGLVAARELITLGDGPMVEYQIVVTGPILQRLVGSASVISVRHCRVLSGRHPARSEPRMLDARGFSREKARFDVHWPIHVDDVQSQKAIADGLEPGFIDTVARLGQKSVSYRQHSPEGRYDTNPHVRDREPLLDSCRLKDLHSDDRIRRDRLNQSILMENKNAKRVPVGVGVHPQRLLHGVRAVEE
jgi:hypothetical protein